MVKGDGSTRWSTSFDLVTIGTSNCASCFPARAQVRLADGRDKDAADLQLVRTNKGKGRDALLWPRSLWGFFVRMCVPCVCVW